VAVTVNAQALPDAFVFSESCATAAAADIPISPGRCASPYHPALPFSVGGIRIGYTSKNAKRPGIVQPNRPTA